LKRTGSVKRLLLLSIGLLIVGGCATSRVSSANSAGEVARQLSVERFLQASNARDYVGMSRIFGTSDGPIGDTGSAFGCFWKKLGAMFGGTSCPKWQDVEVRLDAIAEILQHDDYQIVSEGRVAGRAVPASRIGVDLDLPTSPTVRDVGFIVVMSDGRWMIECIELDKVTSGTHDGTCRGG
jgi:hypothetical protein